MDTIGLSFVFNKYYSIIDYLGLKYLSRKLQINYAINYFFYLYLMLHASAVRFDGIQNLKKKYKFF